MVQLCAGLIVRQQGACLHNAGMGSTYIKVLQQGVCQGFHLCMYTRCACHQSTLGFNRIGCEAGRGGFNKAAF